MRVIINNSLNFRQHIGSICKKAKKKLTALIRLSKWQSFENCRTLMKPFLESQFVYVQLTWMFHDRKENHKMNSLHERALRIV